jgi:hypothetical protein
MTSGSKGEKKTGIGAGITLRASVINSVPEAEPAITPITPITPISVPTPGNVMANEEIDTFLPDYVEVDLSENVNNEEKKMLLEIMEYSPIESLAKNPKNTTRNDLRKSRSFTPKCYRRYEGYKYAKTYGEFIVRGGTYADFRWNFKRGFLKIHATTEKDEYVIQKILSRITHRPPPPPPIPNPITTQP